VKERYRLSLRRKSVYDAFDHTPKTFQRLKTKDEAEAERLLVALNEAGKQPAMNLSLPGFNPSKNKQASNPAQHSVDLFRSASCNIFIVSEAFQAQ